MRKKTKELKTNKYDFKKRKKLIKNNVKYVFGSSGLKSKKQQRIEGIYLTKTKAKIKKWLKKKKKQHRPKNSKFNYWVFYNPNTTLTKKSKNARMGSGKGKFVRKAYTIAQNKLFIEFKNVKNVWILNFKKYYKIKYNLYFLNSYKNQTQKIVNETKSNTL